MKKQLHLFLLIPAFLALDFRAEAQNAIDSLKPGFWYEVPNSHMADSVEKDPTDEWAGGTGPTSLMVAWSGGAFDTKRNRLVIWGGGHYDYWGNAVYAFDINTLKWNRLTNNSSMAGWTDTTTGGLCHSIMPSDGLPAARHTYDGITYIPDPIDRLWANGGAIMKCGFPDRLTWEFDFNNNTWQRKADEQLNPGAGNICAYDAKNQSVWLQVGGQYLLQEYNLAQDNWNVNNNGNPVIHNNSWCPYGGFTDNATGALDPDHHHFVAVGNGIYDWNLDTASSWCYTVPSSKGDASLTVSSNPGFVWDAAAHVFVGWNGGANVYTLDPLTWTWTKITPSAGNKVIPTNPPTAGTYGRFQYIPSKNAFIAVNSINEDVWVYKLDSARGITTGMNNQPSENQAQNSKVYPNPLQLKEGNNGINITIPDINCAVEIYNTLGRQVIRLKSNGSNILNWDGRDVNRNMVNTGVYIYAVINSTGQFLQTGKISVAE